MSDEVVESVVIPEFSQEQPAAGMGEAFIDEATKLSIVGDVKAKISVLLGDASIRLSELFSLETGSVLKLDTHVEEPVRICLDGTVVAHGFIVAVGDNFGVKISKVLME